MSMLNLCPTPVRAIVGEGRSLPRPCRGALPSSRLPVSFRRGIRRAALFASRTLLRDPVGFAGRPDAAFSSPKPASAPPLFSLFYFLFSRPAGGTRPACPPALSVAEGSGWHPHSPCAVRVARRVPHASSLRVGSFVLESDGKPLFSPPFVGDGRSLSRLCRGALPSW